MKRNKITYERVRELFDYHEDGYLTWKINRGNIKKGSVAGHIPFEGYYQIIIDKKHYQLHRIIFLWHHGYLPELVDHDDRDKTHNWIDNLYDISYQCNSRNCKLSSRNKSGITGLFFSKKLDKWMSRITVNGKSIHIGTFSDFDSAALSRYKKEVELGWNGCNSSSSAYLYLKEKGILPVRKIRKSI